MKTNYLFPHKLKRISGIIFLLTFIFLVIIFFFDRGTFEFRSKTFAFIGAKELSEKFFFSIIEDSITDEILMLFVIPAGIIYAFSKERYEDEMVASVRLHSLAWSTIINYSIILICYTFIYGMPFLDVLMGAMLSQLLIFILLFRYNIYKLNKAGTDEE
ncbi:hypothetical protein GN157_16535 [Flavobacterium rakeshii]|uniref:Uncharacterized protein n=1 Tax=Flavobacterium rakeshii TaxID=1038845 RepID=A0A6N8HI33_9FLAO|nr:hypothetical protein [Flavobacterium rakeshii]MEE1897373.1 hypothetical protein [Flavobacterium rakeshii]MUV05323.1 hypothetical protein [Flavobacterium rakeshii]